MADLAVGRIRWSNLITLSRLIAAPFFFCALLGESTGTAFVLFWLAVLSDVADGRLARARGEATVFGGLLDHATDASFVALALSALAMRGIVPGVLPALVLLAFVQYVLDSKSLAGHVLRASALGRWNGILYFVPPGIVVTRAMLGLDVPSDELVHLLGVALSVSSGVSMADRAWALLRGRRADDAEG